MVIGQEYLQVLKMTQNSMMMQSFSRSVASKVMVSFAFLFQTELRPHAFVVDNTKLPSVFVNPVGAGVLRTIRCIGTQERVLERFIGRYALRRVELETK